MKTKKTWVGELFFDEMFYADEANKTVCQPGLTSEVLMNRRNVTDKLTEEGKKMLERVKKELTEELVSGVKVSFVFSKYCGCSMCPCSPGFKVIVNYPVDIKVGRSTDESRFHVWVDKDTMEFRQPSKVYYLDTFTGLFKANYPNISNKKITFDKM